MNSAVLEPASSNFAREAMPLKRRLRHLIARTVWQANPSLFYLAADKQARAGITVRRTGATLEIIRPSARKMIRLSADNALYLPLMVEAFDYFFGSVRPVRVRRDGANYGLVDFSTPRLHWITGFDDFPVLCPSLTEPFVTTEQYLEFARLGEGDVAFDLGAYCGLSSIAFSKAVGPSGKVIAAEPDPLNHWAATENIEAHARTNELHNIELVDAAVGPAPRVIQFSSEGAMGSSAASIVGAYRGTVIDVEVLTLQMLADRNGVGRVSFLKIDIEGAELSLILGSGEFLKQHRPKIIMEAHPIDGALTSVPIIAFLEQQLGYRCKVVDQTGLKTLPLVTGEPG